MIQSLWSWLEISYLTSRHFPWGGLRTGQSFTLILASVRISKTTRTVCKRVLSCIIMNVSSTTEHKIQRLEEESL